MNKMNVAVLGVGRMGSNHARVLTEMDSVHLAAICDAGEEAAEKIARKYFIPGIITG